MSQSPDLPRTQETRRFRLGSSDEALLALEVAIAFAAVLRYFFFTIVLIWPDSPLLSDFVAFWTGASLLRDGAGPALYDTQRQQALQADLLAALTPPDVIRVATGHTPYHNPPPLALLFIPLTSLDFASAYILWFALDLAAFVASLSLLLRGHPRGIGKALVLLAFGGVAFSLREGQVNVLFLLSLSLAIIALRGGRRATGGALLGLLWLKPQYAAPFALLLLFKRRWRELGGMAAVALGIGALSIAMVGPGGIAVYLAEMQRIGTFRAPAEAFVSADAMVNWRAVLLNLWPDISDGWGNALVLVLGGTTVLAALLGCRGEWKPESPRFAAQMLVVTIAAVLASPHSHLHGSVLLLAPVAMLLADFYEWNRCIKGLRTLLIGGLLLSVAVLPFPQQRWLMVPYMLVWLVLLAGPLRGRNAAM